MVLRPHGVLFNLSVPKAMRSLVRAKEDTFIVQLPLQIIYNFSRKPIKY